jgi:hypothetical protein
MNNNRKKYELRRQLLRRGFDQSQTTTDGVQVKCSRCAAVVVNGIATHQRGCPNNTR